MAQEVNVRSIGQHEDQIASELMPTIQPYLALLMDTYTFSGAVIQSGFPEINSKLSKQVLTRLLVRLNNDLRAIFLLANVGYDVQGNAIAASVYECAFTMATIAESDAMAEEWLNWTDPKKTYKDAYSLTDLGLKNINVHRDWLDHFYKVYRQLCWGKHLNPISEKQGGMERTGNTIDYVQGPRADDLTARGVCFCCTYTALLAFIGLQIYIEKHTLSENRGAMVSQLNLLATRQHELYKQGLERWGSEDSFPGQW